VGVADGVLTVPAIHTWYAGLVRPPGTPPNWAFATVWTVLYVMIAVAAWLVWHRTSDRRALSRWGWALLANALWSPLFFSLHLLGVALIEAVILTALGCVTAVTFIHRSRTAAWLMLPYVLWTCYATYLAAGFWWLNPG
jgi:tryptophan-rich sensory protein